MAGKPLPAFLKKKGASDDDEDDSPIGAFVPKKKGKGKVPPQFAKHAGKGKPTLKSKKSAAVKKRLANLKNKNGSKSDGPFDGKNGD